MNETTAKFGPSGGRWTIVNRIRCAMLGHIIPPAATTHGQETDTYLCARCNVFCYFFDRESSRGFRSFDDWYEEVGQYRPRPSVHESFFGTLDGAK